MKAKPVQLYNLEIVVGRNPKQIVLRNVHYGVAVAEKKKQIAKGVFARQIWINKIDLPKSVIINK